MVSQKNFKTKRSFVWKRNVWAMARLLCNPPLQVQRYTSFCTCLFQMQFDNKGFTPVKMDDLGFTPVQFDSRGFTPVKLPEHEDQGVPDSPFTLISGVSL